MIRSYAFATAAGLAALTSISAFAADPLPTESHKVLTADLAVEAAQAAIAACKTQGYGVSVVVADRTGTPKVVIVRDGPRGVGPPQGLHGRPAEGLDRRLHQKGLCAGRL